MSGWRKPEDLVWGIRLCGEMSIQGRRKWGDHMSGLLPTWRLCQCQLRVTTWKLPDLWHLQGDSLFWTSPHFSESSWMWRVPTPSPRIRVVLNPKAIWVQNFLSLYLLWGLFQQDRGEPGYDKFPKEKHIKVPFVKSASWSYRWWALVLATEPRGVKSFQLSPQLVILTEDEINGEVI